ncbi:MAG: TonB-dependent receptor [Vicingaceae bacterium]
MTPSLFIKSNVKLWLVLLLFGAFGQIVNAQYATVKGIIFEKESQEPVIFTNVALEGTKFGMPTDNNGYYALTKVPPGTYQLVVSNVGYEKFTESITLKAGDIISRNIYLETANVKLETINISAEKQESMTEVRMSVVKLTPKDIDKIPAVGGEADLAQALQVQPGVVFTGDQGGQLFIRGGSPIQNLVLLDGMIIYNPFHTIGLFSVFETDIIKTADVYTGGFNANYGGRISSVIDIRTRDGNKNRVSGEVGMSTFGAKAILDVPVSSPKELGDGGSSLLFSAKTLYLNETSKSLYTYVDQELPYSFLDLYGKYTIYSGNGTKLNLFGFNYQDRANFTDISSIKWDSWGFGMNPIIIPSQSNVLIDIVIAYSQYAIATDDEASESSRPDVNRRSSINAFNAGMNFTNYVADDQVKYGFQIVGMGTEFDFINDIGRKIEQNQNTTELSGYFTYRINSGKFIIEPSLRLQYYSSLSEFSPEPRVGMKYNVSNDLRLKAAAGRYSQNLISGTSDRDVVNLFYSFLTGPENLQKEFVNQDGSVTDVTSKLQKATHALIGFEYDINNNLMLNVEGYYKWFNQLTNINRNKLFDEGQSDNAGDISSNDFIVETGDAYGVDFLLKYRHKELSVYGIYSIGFVKRWDGNQEYWATFDRRHNINVLGSYTFGKDLNWEAGVRWNLGSGFPFTPTNGYYGDLDFTDIGEDYTTYNPDDVSIDYGDLNSKRLPWYSRFDITLKRRFVLSENSILEANASCTNIFNRENIFYLDRVSQKRVNQLPIMPSLGMSLSF